jgi:hypothetical protein
MEATQNKQNATFQITGDWNAQSKELKKKYSRLTDADLKFEPGKEEDMLKRVVARLGKKREEVIKIIRKDQPGLV